MTDARRLANKGLWRKKTGNLHDKTFRSLMSEPETAGMFLSENLPADIVALFESRPPELVPGSFIDAKRAEHRSDLL